jgi:SAM-dependent methyltransferase
MHWKLKAAIQNIIAALPPQFGDALYYRLQRATRSFRNSAPRLLSASALTVRYLNGCGFDVRGKSFMEVGTGRSPTLAMGYWLMGAKATFTVDLHRYVKPELVEEALAYIRGNPDDVRSTFGDLLVPDRLETLLSSSFDAAGLMAAAGIRYLAPADAASVPLPDASIDFHTSYTVLEHIPPAVIERIFREGNRVVRPGGAFAHLVDYSDHFWHSHREIGPFHFLRYSDADWQRIAGNRFMFMNRLLHDDYQQLLADVRHRIVAEHPILLTPTDQAAIREGRVPLAPTFASKSRDTLAIGGSWFITVHETAAEVPR